MARASSSRTTVTADDGVVLAARVEGRGAPIVFVHEFTGDLRSWSPQVAHFKRRYRSIVFNARGYPPSDVPDALAAYSQDRAADDVAAVIRALSPRRPAHVVGLSMGGFAALHAGLRFPKLVRSLVLAGVGYGAKPEQTARYARDSRRDADRVEQIGIARYARQMAADDYAQPLKRRSVAAWRRFARELADHSARGMAQTLRGVLARRPSLWRLEADLARMRIPTLILAGDRDEPCLDPGLYLRRTIPGAQLAVLAGAGHLLNLEQPDRFNRTVADFLAAVER